MTIKIFGRKFAERAIRAGECLVANKRVKVTEFLRGCCDNAFGGCGVAEVCMHIGDARAVAKVRSNTLHNDAHVIGTPRLFGVMGSKVVAKHICPIGGEPASGGVPNARAAAYTSNKNILSTQGKWVSGELGLRFVSHVPSTSNEVGVCC